jgi:hypothetical protein
MSGHNMHFIRKDSQDLRTLVHIYTSKAIAQECEHLHSHSIPITLLRIKHTIESNILKSKSSYILSALIAIFLHSQQDMQIIHYLNEYSGFQNIIRQEYFYTVNLRLTKQSFTVTNSF